MIFLYESSALQLRINSRCFRNVALELKSNLSTAPYSVVRDKSTLTLSVRLRTNSGVTCLETAARSDLVQARTVLSTVLL